MKVHAVVAAAALLAAPAAGQQAPRQAGDELRARLGAAPPRAELEGNVRLPVFVGAARSGTSVLSLRTGLATTADGTRVYRLQDRLEVDLPGLGLAVMLVRADLRADLSAVEVVLETEEPRGQGTVSRQRVRLRREGGRWLRSVTRGEAATTEEPLPDDLPADLLVLTPPLGAGERLARLAPADLGARLSVRALDLETGQGATWRLSVEDRRQVALLAEAPPLEPGRPPPPPAPKGQLEALLVLRQEAAASLWTLRDLGPGGAPLRLQREGPARLVALDPRLDPAGPPAAPAVDRVLSLLRALAAGDADGARDALDLAALRARAGAPAAAPFEQALLGALLDATWLRERGLLLATLSAGADDLVATPDGPARMKVRPRAGPADGPAFVVEEKDGRWRVIDLPRR